MKNALTESTYFILISLYEPLHGYGIMQKISELSNGRITMGAGTLYGAIVNMLDKKWIEIYSVDESSRKKKEYIITEVGKQVVKDEIKRLEELISCGKRMEEN